MLIELCGQSLVWELRKGTDKFQISFVLDVCVFFFFYLIKFISLNRKDMCNFVSEFTFANVC